MCTRTWWCAGLQAELQRGANPSKRSPKQGCPATWNHAMRSMHRCRPMAHRSALRGETLPAPGQVVPAQAARLQLLRQRPVGIIVFATTSKPVVSLSRRCTIPGRLRRCGKLTMVEQTLTRVPPVWLGAGCTTILRLFTTRRSRLQRQFPGEWLGSAPPLPAGILRQWAIIRPGNSYPGRSAVHRHRAGHPLCAWEPERPPPVPKKVRRRHHAYV